MAKKDNKDQLFSKLKSVGVQAAKEGHSHSAIADLLHRHHDNNKTGYSKQKIICYSLVVAALSLFLYAYYDSSDPRCLISNNLLVMELARPAVSCDMCKGIDHVPTVDGDTFTKEQFLRDFAYTGVPLLVKGGAKNWTALSTFNFEYLRDLYESTEGALESIDTDCQFFPYKSEFDSMAEVFEMSEEQSKFEKGQQEWYVGW